MIYGKYSSAGEAEGMPDRGGASDARSRAYARVDAAKTLGGHIVGFLKGKSAIYIAHRYARRPGNATGQSFWARGYDVSTVGYNEQAIRQYIRDQEKAQLNAEQQTLFKR